MASDLTVTLEDRPGALAQMGEVLGEAGINIDGICAFEAAGTGVIHLLVADASAAREALSGAGIGCGPDREVEVLPIVDQPGELGRHLRRVADAGVNVDLVYLATGTRVVIGADDAERLRGALSG